MAGGKDFVVSDVVHQGGRYVNKNDAPVGAQITVRFCEARKLVVVQKGT